MGTDIISKLLAAAEESELKWVLAKKKSRLARAAEERARRSEEEAYNAYDAAHRALNEAFRAKHTEPSTLSKVSTHVG